MFLSISVSPSPPNRLSFWGSSGWYMKPNTFISSSDLDVWTVLIYW